MIILKTVFAVFAVIGALDKIAGNRLKLGEEFEKGIMTIGTLALAMVGMITVSPVIAELCIPVFTPLSNALGIDISFIAGFIANDMGGATLAKELANGSTFGAFHGLVVASMMGVTISFTIPVALAMTKAEYKKDVLLGILSGVSTIPLGIFVSGILIKIQISSLLLNMAPSIVVSAMTCLGLVFIPKIACKVFSVIGVLVGCIITAGLALGILDYLTGIKLVSGIANITDGFSVVVDIAIVLSGVFPLIALLSRLFKKAFLKIGYKTGLDEASVVGFVASVANSIPTFKNLDKMNSKGRILNMAFAVSAAFVFGDHLAFTIAFDEAFVLPVVVGKLVSGISAVCVATMICKNRDVH